MYVPFHIASDFDLPQFGFGKFLADNRQDRATIPVLHCMPIYKFSSTYRLLPAESSD
jgi:hypothetical protein